MIKEKKKKHYWIFILILVIMILDQVTKIVIVSQKDKLPIDVIPNVLSISYVENTGGAFGIGSNNVVMFVITEFVVLGIIIRFMLLQKEMMNTKTKIALSMVLAGGFSNLIDRLMKGSVIDFIQVHFFHFPLFNIADMSIVIGWITFLAFMASYTVKVRREIREKEEEIKMRRGEIDGKDTSSDTRDRNKD